MKKRYVLIVAGGKGLRMGNELPKQFMPIRKRPILMFALDCFHEWGGGEIIIVLPKEYVNYWKWLCRRYSCAIPHRVVEGGETRFDSVRNGLTAISKPGAGLQGLVAVHDGVRPFVPKPLIEACFIAAEHYGAVVPVIPMSDSIREAESGGWPENRVDYMYIKSHAVRRHRYVSVQTPQVFKLDLLQEAYGQPYSQDFTDDASVVEAMGFEVRTIAGSRDNIKITDPFDLHVAEAWLTNSWL
ncbi:MAG: 2-C-methyl-D-erythritol 4-phosphate cytidylyltransferase [Tannerellaceae bacterium]|jgi:2-C-methyl-D-erythritol 4-phosphate cytidylyltransferase|nr:2-C-methyl-D-erythritol 4-phosphate cytidylyltransferase [Tannerellaceae bacterium]